MKFGEGKKLKNGDFGPNTQDLEINLSKLQEGESIKIRLVGEVLPNYRYWVTTRDGKKKPKLTPFFNRETESISSEDPLLGNAQKEFFYVCNCLVRGNGSPEMKILILKSTVYQYLYSLALDDEYGDPADPVTGYDIVITKERTGPKPMNVKYNCRPGRGSTPLTPEEQALELYNLEELYNPGTKSDYVAWVKENTAYLDTEMLNEAYGQPDANVKPESDIPF